MYERSDPSRVGPDLADRVALALADIDDARKPSDLDLPGYRLHRLKGGRRQQYGDEQSPASRTQYP